MQWTGNKDEFLKSRHAKKENKLVHYVSGMKGKRNWKVLFLFTPGYHRIEYDT